jgi:trimeric autotransporter adhesin
MKKLFILSYFVFLISYSLFAQSVGIGTNAPNASAQLDVTATNKGILVPRVTNAQMLAIASPANGLLVYNTDSASFAYRNATAWVFVKGNNTASNDWSTKGNAGTDTSKNFIGTTDNQDLIFKRNNIRAGFIGSSSKSNTSWGLEALNPSTTGSYNVAIGSQALKDNTFGSNNVANGVGALKNNNTGSNNVANGNQALLANTSGYGNTAVGSGSLPNLNGLYGDNTAIGNAAFNSKTSGSTNTALGSYAGQGNIVGSGNLFLGYRAGRLETGSNKLYISNEQTDSNHTLIYGEFDNKLLRSNGRMEINSDNTTSVGLKVIKNYAVGSNSNVAAIYAENNVDNTSSGANGNYGIGIEGRGGKIGVQGISQAAGTSLQNIAQGVSGIATGNHSGSNHGVYGEATGGLDKNVGVFGASLGSGIDNYGLYGSAQGSGTNNYGVYAKAINGTTNYAGYFDGKVGINIPNVALQLSNDFGNRRMVLYEVSNNDHQFFGLGISAGTLRYQVGGTNNAHRFYAGTSSSTSTELMAIKGDGNIDIPGKLGLGKTASSFPLEIKGIINSDNHDIMKFYQGATAKWHLTIKTGGELSYTESNVADDRLVLGTSGRIGLDLAAPLADLHIKVRNETYTGLSGSNNDGGIRLERQNTTDSWNILVDDGNDFDFNYNGQTEAYIDNVTGAYNQISDQRLKKDIAPISNVLSNVLQLQPKMYHYLRNKTDDPLSYGFMAQEVEQLFPSFVNTKGKGDYKAISYQNFSVIAIKAIQEQQQIINKQEERIAKLEAMMKALTGK